MTSEVTAGPRSGLTAAEVRQRVEAGQTNDVPLRPSRSLASILRANVLTRFNAILGALLVVIVIVGPLKDGLFGVVLVANTTIGVVQEWRAKRALDRLAVLTAPRARVVRAGVAAEIAVAEVVLDDVLELRPGDQAVVDGVVLESAGLEMDESLVSGESEPVDKAADDEILSGSFVAAGGGCYRATRVGAEAYAAQLTEQAQRFTLVNSQLQAGIGRILTGVTWLIVPVAILLIVSQLARDEGLADALRGSVAGVGSMVPEGLVLLTSVAFAVGVVRLGGRRVVVQELPAIETLARVDVVCLDKTGTLTTGDMALERVQPLRDDDVTAVLAAMVAAEPSPNASLRAVAAGTTTDATEPVTVHEAVPFSSARKWSAIGLDGEGGWVLGAPDVLLDGRGHDDVLRRAEADADSGRRVLLLARAPDGLAGEVLPDQLEPSALLVLREELRDDAAETLDFFARQQVTVKVISGDHARTVGAVATRLGLAGAAEAVDARSLADVEDDDERLGDAVEQATVLGRVTPHQKRAMVRALQARGHVVAMGGDGVNDVLALKDADIGVAMGSGSAAARGVAQLVLLDSSFAVLPSVVAEGRRVIANVERVANLFVTKTVYATLIALAVGVARVPFPFFPRHLTVVSSLTIGVPAFFLALAPNARRAQPGFVPRVLRFALPAGMVAAAATFTAYQLVRSHEAVSLAEARTTATMVLFSVGLWVLAILARPATAARRALVMAMGGAFLLVLSVPALRRFFDFDVPTFGVSLAAVAVVVLAALLIEGGWRLTGWVRRPGSSASVLGRSEQA